MGYYTELKLYVELNNEAPYDILKLLCDGEMYEHITKTPEPAIRSVDSTPHLPIEHKFGKSYRWDQIFNYAVLNKNSLKINCDIKAYDNIYEDLVDWLEPYIITGNIKIKGEDSDNWEVLLNR